MPWPSTKICARCGLEKPRLEFYGQAWCWSREEAYKPEHRAEMIRDANELGTTTGRPLGNASGATSRRGPGECSARAVRARRFRGRRLQAGAGVGEGVGRPRRSLTGRVRPAQQSSRSAAWASLPVSPGEADGGSEILYGCVTAPAVSRGAVALAAPAGPVSGADARSKTMTSPVSRISS